MAYEMAKIHGKVKQIQKTVEGNNEKKNYLLKKKMIEGLQERIKSVQDEYEEAGKIKIEKYREN